MLVRAGGLVGGSPVFGGSLSMVDIKVRWKAGSWNTSILLLPPSRALRWLKRHLPVARLFAYLSVRAAGGGMGPQMESGVPVLTPAALTRAGERWRERRSPPPLYSFPCPVPIQGRRAFLALAFAFAARARAFYLRLALARALTRPPFGVPSAPIYRLPSSILCWPPLWSTSSWTGSFFLASLPSLQ